MAFKRLIFLPAVIFLLGACSSMKSTKNFEGTGSSRLSESGEDYRDLAAIQDENEKREFMETETYQAFQKAFPKIWSEGLGGDNSKYMEPLPLQPTGRECMEGSLVVLDYAKLRVTYDGKSFDEGPGMSGSAGKIVGIYSVKGKPESDTLEVSELFNNNVYEVTRVLGEGNCPDLEVELSGVYFNRVGSESGLAKLKFDKKTKSYELEVN